MWTRRKLTNWSTQFVYREPQSVATWQKMTVEYFSNRSLHVHFEASQSVFDTNNFLLRFMAIWGRTTFWLLERNNTWCKWPYKACIDLRLHRNRLVWTFLPESQNWNEIPICQPCLEQGDEKTVKIIEHVQFSWCVIFLVVLGVLRSLTWILKELKLCDCLFTRTSSPLSQFSANAPWKWVQIIAEIVFFPSSNDTFFACFSSLAE